MIKSMKVIAMITLSMGLHQVASAEVSKFSLISVIERGTADALYQYAAVVKAEGRPSKVAVFRELDRQCQLAVAGRGLDVAKNFGTLEEPDFQGEQNSHLDVTKISATSGEGICFVFSRVKR